MLGNFNDIRQKEAINALQGALQDGDTAAAQTAWGEFYKSIVETVKEDYAEYDGDRNALMQRGYRQLTAAEKKFYDDMIRAGKSQNPKQAWDDLLAANTDFMPQTIIEDVYKDLVEAHPLLNHVRFQNVSYLTKWLLNDHSRQSAVWGPVNSQITKQIESSFREIDMNICKLSAYALIPEDMLDLGPTYLDGYIRAILREAIAVALEEGIVSGNGLNSPIGLDRDIHQGVSVSSSTGYPEKQAVSVTSFMPEEYGALLAKLAVSEVWYTADANGAITDAETAANTDGSPRAGYTKHGGHLRSFDRVTLVCNQVDYLTKIMPATTVLTAGGSFAGNLFPFPTDVIRSSALATGKAIVFLPEEYFMGLGTSKDGTIEYSDEFKFLEDQRTYKIKLHGNGRAFDNTVAVVLDISNLDPAYITVLNKTEPEG